MLHSSTEERASFCTFLFTRGRSQLHAWKAELHSIINKHLQCFSCNNLFFSLAKLLVQLAPIFHAKLTEALIWAKQKFAPRNRAPSGRKLYSPDSLSSPGFVTPCRPVEFLPSSPTCSWTHKSKPEGESKASNTLLP